MRILACVLVPALFVALPARADESQARVRLGGVIKLAYTHRDRDSRSGVSAVDEAAMRWIGIEAAGELGSGAGWLIELGSTLYEDPITGGGTGAASGPGEMGPVGIRQAYMIFYPALSTLPSDVPPAAVKVGTFIPPWGSYQDRGPAQWDFADLPLIYYHPAFRQFGWQNTGFAIDCHFLAYARNLPAWAPDDVHFSQFLVNGYFPYGLAGAESPFSNESESQETGLGTRLLIGKGPLRVWAGYYFESFGRDQKGGPALESYAATAWIAGIEARGPAGFFLAEWRSLVIGNYQLLTDGSWSGLQSEGGYASGGINLPGRLAALVRFDWLDPNTSDSAGTVLDSRNDQISVWTFGLDCRPAEAVTIKLNYVLPREQGKMIDTAAGRVGGAYTARDDNYVRLQIELVF